MKIVPFLLALIFTSCSFSQNEWWRIGKNNESETEKVEETVEESPEVVEEIEVKDTISEDWVSDQLVEPDDITPGSISVKKSPAIDKIIEFKSTTISPNLGPLMDGYRIQLFFDQDRSAVDKARSEVLLLDNEIQTYIEYKAPNYFLLQGDYRTQLSAEKERSKIIEEFPTAIVIEDKIYLPKIEEESEEEGE